VDSIITMPTDMRWYRSVPTRKNSKPSSRPPNLPMGAPGTPQILVTIAARFGRVSWKYSALAYSLILKDVGVLMQTLYLIATDYGAWRMRGSEPTTSICSRRSRGWNSTSRARSVNLPLAAGVCRCAGRTPEARDHRRRSHRIKILLLRDARIFMPTTGTAKTA